MIYITLHVSDELNTMQHQQRENDVNAAFTKLQSIFTHKKLNPEFDCGLNLNWNKLRGGLWPPYLLQGNCVCLPSVHIMTALVHFKKHLAASFQRWA